ncbi:glycerophosphodiester phosphodiesterase [Paracnuella aquatica]|nr:glycerophosphodiester phosphodiesterase [Paracnuella aquatica]
MFRICLVLLALVATQCNPVRNTAQMKSPSLDLQGHRGARGLLPENTIPSMLRAIDLGATTLELDVVISGDKQVVVSHDHYFHEHITTAPDGSTFDRATATRHLLYQIPYDSIRKYDVGLKPHPSFPQQEKMAVYKPLLSELLQACEQHAKTKGKSVRYNIEIKSSASGDGTRHPAPPEFVTLVLDVLRQQKLMDHAYIQSFDVRPLQYLHQQHPGVTVSYLVEASKEPMESQLSKLGFVPSIYSPHFSIVTKELVQQVHAKGMKIVPWTVNELAQMQQLVDAGVDGIISDYPNLFSQLVPAK